MARKVQMMIVWYAFMLKMIDKFKSKLNPQYYETARSNKIKTSNDFSKKNSNYCKSFSMRAVNFLSFNQHN